MKHQSIPILMYHSISNQSSLKYKNFTLAPEMFDSHLDYLTQSGYTPLTITSYLEAKADNLLPVRPVILTFDDGLADFYEGALPLLQKHNFTATLYVATGFMGQSSRWLAEIGEGLRPMLSWEQLQTISAAGIECGSHSHHHYELDTISLEAARQEILLSKQILEEQLGHPIKTFAYPYGYHTPTLQRMVQAAGYTSACAVLFKLSSIADQPFALPRLMVERTTNVTALAAMLEGHDSGLLRTYKQTRTLVWQLIRRSRPPVQFSS